MKNTYLSFIVGKELYAVNVNKVLEVLEMQRITSVPNAPEYVMGIINFRGEIVPVFETRIKFNIEQRTDSDSYVIVVFDLSKENEILRIGAIVDRVKDVIEINDDDIKPVPTMSKDFNAEFLHGIFKLKNDFILLLNVEKIFTGNELVVLQESNNYKEEVI
jgi:purine-binding chemotaxis protein CheW